MTNHGEKPIRGDKRVPLSPINEGRFGRMFRRLPPAPEYDEATLTALADQMHELVAAPSGGWSTAPQPQPEADNEAIPAAYTYLGQFIDHDITFDPNSALEQEDDPDAMHNFRTPKYDLDSVYGSGPLDEPFQYENSAHPVRLLVGESFGQLDLPRNSEGRAIIGDPRNDENIIVSQLQLLFMRLHNKFAEEVIAEAALPEPERFREAQRRTRWHYQRMVIDDYLRRLVGDELVDNLVDIDPTNGLVDFDLKYYVPKKNVYMPIEFSAAAFRFGHSQVRGVYDLNGAVTGRPVFLPGEVGPLDDLRGNRPLPAGWSIDWSHFVDLTPDVSPQPSRLIDTHLAEGLFSLPGGGGSLALRNLVTGQRLGLPSGQDVAKFLRVPEDQQLTDADLTPAPVPTPLWFYVLKEAEGRPEGKRLGPVGSRIVAEVLLGMVKLDKHSWINVDPSWKPTIPVAGERLTLADLIRYVGTSEMST